MANANANAKEKTTPSQWDKLDVPVEHAGRAITLPAEPGKMPLNKAIEALVRRQKDEEQEFKVQEVIDAYPHDAAVAFTKAMIKLYGWGSPQTRQGFFGPDPPKMLAVKVGVADDDVVQCPMGDFKLPGIDELITTGIYPRLGFVIHGTVKKRDRHVVLELATETRRIVREESIYKGKPIRLMVDEDGTLDTGNPPTFMDVSDISESDVLFDGHIQSQIDTNILVPMKATALCRKHKIPLKRGILLEGSYGTGKSLTAKLAARVAEQNGWTFVLLDKVQGLRAALEFANRYAPAVVFAEDIDRVAEDRDDAANDLINTIDGVVSKRSEIMTVLTTNFVERINPVILRPGRLDAVISLKAPNADTVQRLVRYYAGVLLPADTNLSQVGETLDGQIPASIRECVERAKLGMIGRGAMQLASVDLMVAAQTMKNHLALLNRKQAQESAGDKLAASLKAVVMNGGEEKLAAIHTVVKEIQQNI
jgi:AAA+ superfamily predicted ATPase